MRSTTSLVLLPFMLLLAACSSDDQDASHDDHHHHGEEAALEDEIAALKSKVQALEEQLASANGDRSSLQADLDAAKAALKQAEDELGAQDFAAAKKALDEANAALDALKAAFAALAGSLILEAKFGFDGQVFELDTPYTLAESKTVSFSEVRYWLTNVKLTRAVGASLTVPNSYYLIEIMKAQAVANGTQAASTLPASRRENVDMRDIGSGVYTGIEFSVGVDAARNDNLALGGGELNVLKNMTSFSWMWFTSYIFTKVKGTYVDGAASPVNLAWETGTNANLRTVTKSFATPISVGADKTTKVSLRLDVKKLFASLDPGAKPAIGAGTPTERDVLSNNWSSAFELVSASSPTL